MRGRDNGLSYWYQIRSFIVHIYDLNEPIIRNVSKVWVPLTTSIYTRDTTCLEGCHFWKRRLQSIGLKVMASPSNLIISICLSLNSCLIILVKRLKKTSTKVNAWPGVCARPRFGLWKFEKPLIGLMAALSASLCVPSPSGSNRVLLLFTFCKGQRGLPSLDFTTQMLPERLM